MTDRSFERGADAVGRARERVVDTVGRATDQGPVADLPVTRRALLSGAGVAGVGALGGFATGSYLADRESPLGGLFRGGELDLTVAWETDSGTTVTGDGGVSVEVGPLSPGESGAATVEVALPDGENNPGYVWLRSHCPTPSTGAAAALSVGLWYVDCDDGSLASSDPVVAGDLCTVAEDLLSGIPLDGDPTTPGRDCLGAGDAVCLRLEWTLDEAYRGDEGTTVAFDVAAVQCRHGDGAANPFPAVAEGCDCGPYYGPGLSWMRVYACDPAAPDCDCVLVGTFELDEEYAACQGTDGITDNRVVPGRYDLFEDDDCVDTGYDLAVTDTRENADGETVAVAFALLADDGGPDLCAVELKADSTVVTYGPDALVDNHTDGLLATIQP